MTCKQKRFVEFVFYRELLSNNITPKFSFIHSQYEDDGQKFIQSFVIKNGLTVAVFDRVYIEPDGHVLNFEFFPVC